MEQQTINQLLESIRTMSSMLADLQQQVQQLKEEREDKKDLPPLNPLLEKTEEREESEGEGEAGRAKRKVFVKPSVNEVHNYLYHLNETRFTAEEFWNYYEARGWMLTPRTRISDWKACVRTWICKRNKSDVQTNFQYNYGQQTPKQQHPAESADERRDRERQQRLRSLEAAVARKLG